MVQQVTTTSGKPKPGLKRPSNSSGMSNVSPAAGSPLKRRYALSWKVFAVIQPLETSVAGRGTCWHILSLAQKLHGGWQGEAGTGSSS